MATSFAIIEDRMNFLDNMIQRAYNTLELGLGSLMKYTGTHYITRSYEILKNEDVVESTDIMMLKYHLFALLEEMTLLQDEYNMMMCDEADDIDVDEGSDVYESDYDY